MKTNKLPAGWDESRVRRVLTHYEGQSDKDAIAEDEAAYAERTHSLVDVPIELLPAVRQLIAKQGVRTGPRGAQKTKSGPASARRKRRARPRASPSRGR